MADARVRGLAALIALLFGLGTVAVVTVEQPAGSSRVGLGSAGVVGRPGEGDPSPSTATTGVPMGGAAPEVPAADQPAGPSTAGGIPAPKPGTYRYKYTRTTRSEFSTTTFEDEKTEEIERRIERVSTSPSEVVDRRHAARQTTDGPDGSKSESSSYEERVWRADGTYLRTEVSESSNTAPDGSTENDRSECDWEPDRIQLAFPLKAGLTWSWDSTCSDKSEEGESQSRHRGSGKVVGAAQRDVSGVVVETFVVELEAVHEVDGRYRPDGGEREYAFRTRIEQRTTSHFAPALGLAVRVEGHHVQTSNFEGGPDGFDESKTTQDSVSELLGTEPT